MSAVATTLSVLETAGRITVETLELLVDILTDPASAHTYCDKVGVPPFSASGEWAPAVRQLRQKADAASKPEDWAEITGLAIRVIGGINGALSHGGPAGPGPVEGALLKILVPALLYTIPKAKLPGGYGTNVAVYTVLSLVLFTDQRLQESYPQGLFAERWGAILGDLALKAGWGRKVAAAPGEEDDSEFDWAPTVSDAAALVTVVMTVLLERDLFKRRLIRFWYGFDQPDLPATDAEARRLAQHAFTLLVDAAEKQIAAADFDAPLKPQPPEEPPAPLAFTLVPVPATATAPSKLFVQVRGQADIDEELGAGFRLRMSNGASFGLLASREGLEPTGNVSFMAEIVRDGAVGGAGGATAGGGGTGGPATPREGGGAGLRFDVGRFSLGARASVDELSAWLRIERGELEVSGGTWLDDFIPRLRFTFDLTAEASVLGGVRFKGGAGGDVLIPINQRLPLLIGTARIESVRIGAVLGDDGTGMAFRVEAAANLTLELFTILKVTVNGIGASYRAGTSPSGDGNVAGIAAMGWDAVIPEGAGLELKVWKITGGGAVFYDRARGRLSGAVELHFADRFSLTGLGIYQRATAASVQSWLVVVSLELPQSGAAFSVQGIGLLYGSNRTTSPQAFLAGIATGDLDAVLFPEDPIGHAAQYLAALERLFPTQGGASVLGVSAKFSALGGMLTLDLGVLFEFAGGSLNRVYIVAQFVGLLKKPVGGVRVDPLTLPFRVMADGVAVWDLRTDELNLRIALRNSRVWAGELTGGASLFHGSPQTDGHGRGTYIAIGGFHPDYVPPGDKIYVPPRLSLVLSKGDHVRLEVRAYAAFTPSSLQFGLSGSIDAHLYGFGIRGHLGLDVLIGFDGSFNVKIEFSVELLLGSHSIAAVRFVGTVVGFTPTVLSGKVEVKFLFWTLSKHGSLTLHEGDTPEETADVGAALAAAVADAANWDSGGAPGLTLADRDRRGVWLSPSAPLRLRQPVTPLGVPIERFGPVKLAAAVTLRIEGVSDAAGTLGTSALSGEFALGMFLNLSREEMLASRGFESRDAGVEILRPLAAGSVAVASTDFEEILIDPLQRPRVTRPLVVVLPGLSVFAPLAARGAPGRPAEPALVRRERFAVVDAGLGLQRAGATFFEARAITRARAGRNGLRIVPESEVAR